MAKEKVKLYKCYYCRVGSPKGEMIQVEVENKNKKAKELGKKIFRYYHLECMTIEKNNKLNGNRRTGVGGNESEAHENGKEKVLNWIMNGTRLIDQFGNKVSIKGDSYSIEAPVTKEYKDIIPSKGNTCVSCFKDYDLIAYDENGNPNNLDDLYKRTGCNKDNYLHACFKCPFNKLTNYMIFDIGAGMGDKYVAAIEIYNTSRVKDYKLRHCIKNNIDLYEIHVSDIGEDKPETIKCNRLWWMENGTIEIHEDYKK